MERNPLLQVDPALLVRHGGVELGADDSRSGAVDANVIIRKLPGQRARELRNGAFGHLIRDVGDNAANPSGGGDQDDRSFLLLLHAGDYGPGQMEDRGHMHIEGALPLFRGEVEKSAVHRTARRVHQDVDAAELPGCIGDRALIVLGNASIRRDQRAFASERHDGVLSPFGDIIQAPGGDCQVGSFAGQSDGGGGANAPRSTGHESGFSRKFHGGELTLLREAVPIKILAGRTDLHGFERGGLFRSLTLVAGSGYSKAMRKLISLFALLVCLGSLRAADDHKTFTAGPLTFSKPEKWSWVDIQPGMRAAQLEVKNEKGKSGEVVFFNIPGGGGGVQANIDRWLGMFQEGRDKINARTEKVKKDKGTITYVQAEGTFMSGMPGGPKTPEPDYMLQGAIVEAGEAKIFVRLTGPKVLVKGAQEQFRAMIESSLK